MTWYSRTEASCFVLKPPAAEAIAAKASLDGAKIVMSDALLSVSPRLAAVAAPRNAVRLAAKAVAGIDGGCRLCE